MSRFVTRYNGRDCSVMPVRTYDSTRSTFLRSSYMLCVSGSQWQFDRHYISFYFHRRVTQHNEPLNRPFACYGIESFGMVSIDCTASHFFLRPLLFHFDADTPLLGKFRKRQLHENFPTQFSSKMSQRLLP